MTHDEAKALLERLERWSEDGWYLVDHNDLKTVLTLARRGLAADKLAEALLEAKGWLLDYSEQHLAKSPPDMIKAKTNTDRARRLAEALSAHQSDTEGDAVLSAPGPDIPAHLKRNAEWKRPKGEPDLTWDEGREGRREGAEEDPADPSTTEAGASWPTDEDVERALDRWNLIAARNDGAGSASLDAMRAALKAAYQPLEPPTEAEIDNLAAIAWGVFEGSDGASGLANWGANQGMGESPDNEKAFWRKIVRTAIVEFVKMRLG